MKSTQYFNKNQKGLTCKNCNAPLRGDENFCPECGQVNDLRRLSLKDYLSGFFANFFSFDSRLYKTMIPLLFKPGKVAVEYIEGKRKKYTNPFQLLLHTVLVYFILLGLINRVERFVNFDKETHENVIKTKKMKIKIGSLSFYTKRNDSIYLHQLDSVFQERDYVTSFNNSKISESFKDSLVARWHAMGIQTLGSYTDTIKSSDESIRDLLEASDEKIRASDLLQAYLTEKNIHYTLATKYYDLGNVFNRPTDWIGWSKKFFVLKDYAQNHEDLSAIEALDSLQIKPTNAHIFLYQKARESNAVFKNKETVKAFWNNVLSKVTLALFFLLPLLTLFFSLLYWRHPHRYSEHLVVVFNIQTAFFLALLISLLLDTLFNTSVFNGFIPFSFILYIFITLRIVYRQNYFLTFIKTFSLVLIYHIMATIGFIIISFIAFFV